MSGRPHMSEKEKEKKKKLLVELLSKTPIVETACQKVGITRMMFYRWKEDDSDFTEAIEDALSVSRERTNDLAESQIINKIKDDHFGACTFWLRNNCKRYHAKKAITAEVENTNKHFNITISEARGANNIDDIRKLKTQTRGKIEKVLGLIFN